jgi:hypothetical protein
VNDRIESLRAQQLRTPLSNLLSISETDPDRLFGFDGISSSSFISIYESSLTNLFYLHIRPARRT